jgi:NAD(P)H-dependent FMN reductase
MKIGVITSTNRQGRKSLNVAEWFMDEASKHTDRLDFVLLDVSDLPFYSEPVSPAAQEYRHESTKKWAEAVAGCDGFVIINAEYNHSYTGVIKNALDTVFHEWSRKVVGFVGYGSYGAESSIMALRPVVSYLNMMPIRESVRIYKSYEAFDESGRPKPEYVQGDMGKFVSELEWWAGALGHAKNQ